MAGAQLFTSVDGSGRISGQGVGRTLHEASACDDVSVLSGVVATSVRSRLDALRSCHRVPRPHAREKVSDAGVERDGDAVQPVQRREVSASLQL
jgi:hypothetical protein